MTSGAFLTYRSTLRKVGRGFSHVGAPLALDDFLQAASFSQGADSKGVGAPQTPEKLSLIVDAGQGKRKVEVERAAFFFNVRVKRNGLVERALGKLGLRKERHKASVYRGLGVGEHRRNIGRPTVEQAVAKNENGVLRAPACEVEKRCAFVEELFAEGVRVVIIDCARWSRAIGVTRGVRIRSVVQERNIGTNLILSSTTAGGSRVSASSFANGA